MNATQETHAQAVADMDAGAFFAALESMEEEDQRTALRARFRYDHEAFARFLWPDRFGLPFNGFHASMFSRHDAKPWDRRVKTTRDVVAAPRGYAKSTIACFSQVVHAIVYELEACIVILSAGQRLAFAQVKDIKGAVEDRESMLWWLYGEIEASGPVSEYVVSLKGRPTVAILPGSFGADVRGWKHPTRGIRPTLVIVDDGEKKDRVRSPEQRRIWWDFLTKDVMKLGPREGGMRLQVRGTVLHTDSMLSRCLGHAGFRSEKWAAIISWPAHPDLWAHCGRLWADLTNLDREDAAEAYYLANKSAMDEGVEVLDPGTEDIYQLYTQIWGEGLASFLQEKQNDPRDPSASVFDVERFARCRIEGATLVAADGRRIALKDLRRRAMRWDPALGDAAGDYTALAVGLRDRYGYTYIVDGWLKKAKPSAQLTAMWALAERWGIQRVSLESNGFQRLLGESFAREKEERKEKGLYWRVACIEEPSTANKGARIAGLEPDCHNGWLQFAERLPPEGEGQFADFPSGGHDDWPDAVEGVHARLGGRPVATETRPGHRLR